MNFVYNEEFIYFININNIEYIILLFSIHIILFTSYRKEIC